MIYDQNRISIEDDTAIALQEDTAKRYEAYGWHVQTVDWTGGEGPKAGKDGDVPRGRPGPVRRARRGPRRDARPSFIVAAHRPRLAGARTRRTPARRTGRRSARTRSARPSRCSASTRTSTSRSTRQALARAREVVDRGRQRHAEWDERFAKWKADNPDRFELWDRLRERRLPAGWQDKLPTFEAGKAVATRKASSGVLNALKDVLPELWGGSADLAESNNTAMEGEPSFLPVDDRDQALGPGRPLRAHPALRHPRARHGLDHERHRAARRHCASTAAPSSCSATTCAPPSGSPPSRSCRSPTSGPTTPSASARTARPTSRSSTWPRCGRSRTSTSSGPADANETAWAWRTDPRAHRPARRPRAQPAEPAHVRPLARRRLRAGGRRRQGRLRPAGGATAAARA